MNFTVRRMNPRDFAGVVGLQRACFPAPFPEDQLWRAEHLQSHFERFSEGQFVAEMDDGTILGSASNCRISLENWRSHRPWEETVGGFHLQNHDDAGEILYGADISVHPDSRRMGIGRSLYAARFALARELGLTYATVCRLPGYCDHADLSLDAYAEKVADGSLIDRTLTPLLKMGLRYAGTIKNYMEDEESGNGGAILEWSE